MAASSLAPPRRALRLAGRRRTHRKVVLDLPTPLLDDIVDDVGFINLTDYLQATIEDDERRRALQKWLHDFEAEHGPITEDEIKEELDRWDSEIRATGGPTAPSSSTPRD
jgi:hypothetical protein